MKKILPLLLLSAAPILAEDPFLGQIKAIKCVGCRQGWVDIVVHDPIDVRDFEIAVKDVDYYKVVTPLPGKQIHDKDGACFYWFDLPKGAKPAAAKRKPVVLPPPAPMESSAPADSSGPRPDSVAVTALDSTLAPPPALAEPEGPPPTPSRCIPYVRSAPASSPSSTEGKK
jgi:hypothetical protein